MRPRCASPLVFALLLFVFGAASTPWADAQTAPELTAVPVAITRVAGESGVFSVTATSPGRLTYQWYSGQSGDVATPVPGATGPLLVTAPHRYDAFLGAGHRLHG